MSAPAPIGALTVGVTAEGLALVAFGDEPARARRAAERLDLAVVDDRPGTGGSAAAVAQLAEYLAGERRTFDLPIDWRLTHAGAQRRVLQALYDTVPPHRSQTDPHEVTFRPDLDGVWRLVRLF